MSGLTKLDAQKTLPLRIKILNWGRNETVNGPVILDAATAAQFAANQKKLGRETVALDFEHNTVPGTEEYKRTTEPRPVAAFAAPVIVENDGMYLERLNWTPEGNKSAYNFLDLSAAPFLDAEDRVIALHSAALTKNGATYDLPTLFDQAEIKAMSATLSTPKEKNTMELKPENVITVAEFAPIVGLAASASKADVLGKLAFLTALSAVIVVKDGKAQEIAGITLQDGKITALSAVEGFENRLKTIETANTKGIATLSATIDGKVVTLNAEDVVKLHAQVQTLNAALTANTTKAEEAERTSLIEQAANDGKLIPLSADTLKTLPLPALKELVGKLPANVVPLSARGKSTTGKTTSDKTGLAKAIELHQAGQ